MTLDIIQPHLNSVNDDVTALGPLTFTAPPLIYRSGSL